MLFHITHLLTNIISSNKCRLSKEKNSMHAKKWQVKIEQNWQVFFKNGQIIIIVAHSQHCPGWLMNSNMAFRRPPVVSRFRSSFTALFQVTRIYPSIYNPTQICISRCSLMSFVCDLSLVLYAIDNIFRSSNALISNFALVSFSRHPSWHTHLCS